MCHLWQFLLSYMIRVQHKFINHQLRPNTETLIIGTFNPETENNKADFFYGRSRNFLWRLLPIALNEEDLKTSSKEKKAQFLFKYKINFTDVISEIKVHKGQESNYNDDYIDNKVTQWRNIISEMDKLKHLKRVCFTRKTFSGVPNIKKQIEAVEKYCAQKNIFFKALMTPSRGYTQEKQKEWTEFFVK